MTRLNSLFLLAAGLAATPSLAANYSATPSAAIGAKRVIVRDVNWSCAGVSCSTSTESSRPLVLCQGLAKRAGRIDAFTVDGRPLGVAELDQCNAAAKGGAATALARN